MIRYTEWCWKTYGIDKTTGGYTWDGVHHTEMAGTGAIVSKSDCPGPNADWQAWGAICDNASKPTKKKKKS